MELFKIGDTDFTDYIIASSYNVDAQNAYKEWEDIFYNLHRDKVKTRITGSFTMSFANDEGAFRDFVELIEAATVGDKTRLTVYLNKKGRQETREFYVTYNPKIKSVENGNVMYEDFNFSLEES